MKLMLMLIVTFVVSSSFAAKKRDIFGSKLKTRIIENHRQFAARSLANSFLSSRQCSKLGQENLKQAKKGIKSFTIGTKITNTDINGAYTPLEESDDFGYYAKLGLPDDSEYLVQRLNTQYAIHADARCARYAKVTKVDRTLFKGKSCRRIHVKIGQLKYKTIFCKGDTKGYVDHFELTSAI